MVTIELNARNIMWRNVFSIIGDGGLTAAASGACSVSVARSNTLFKMMNDVARRAVASRNASRFFEMR